MDLYLPHANRARRPPAHRAHPPRPVDLHFDTLGALHVSERRETDVAIEPAPLFGRRLPSGLRRLGVGAAAIALVGDHARRGAAPRRRPRCSTSPTTRRASSTASSTRPSPRTGRPRATRAVEIADLARRLGQPGAGGHRRARRAGGDAGAGGRHRRHRREVRQDPGRLADAAAAQLVALHLDDRVPGARGQPQGHRRLGRPRRRRRAGDHPQPQDLGRGALELSRRLGLGRQGVGGDEAQDPRVRRQALRQRAGARHRGARLDHDLRPARHRRRAARLGERGVPGAQGARRGPVRHRRALDLDPGRAAGGAGRRATSPPTSSARRPRPISTISTGPRARRWRSSTSTAPGTPAPPTRRTSPASPSSSSSRSTTSAAGPRRSPSTSATAASSTRSTRPK